MAELTKTPKVPGWYWIRDTDARSPRWSKVVRLSISTKDGHAFGTYDFARYCESCEFFGPLDPPTC